MVFLVGAGREMVSAHPILSDENSVRSFLIARSEVDQATRNHPWYDNVWLVRYLAAKAVINHVRPQALHDFVTTLAPLRTRRDFETVDLPRVLSDDDLTAVHTSIRELPASAAQDHESQRFGRRLTRNQPLHTRLHKTLEPLVSELAGEPVEASYNFLSLYSEFGVCEPHMDAPHAKWTLDLCVSQSKTWPIYFSEVVDWPEAFEATDLDDWQSFIRSSHDFKAHELTPGHAVVFSGSSQWHYRDALPDAKPGDYCNLLFFHFLPVGMAEVVRPDNWARYFDIPELDWVVGTIGA